MEDIARALRVTVNAINVEEVLPLREDEKKLLEDRPRPLLQPSLHAAVVLEKHLKKQIAVMKLNSLKQLPAARLLLKNQWVRPAGSVVSWGSLVY